MFGIMTTLAPLIGALIGWFKSYTEKKMELKMLEQKALMNSEKLNIEDRENARENTHTDISITRIVVVAVLTLLIIFLVLYAVLNPSATMAVASIKDVASWLPWVETTKEVSYIQVPMTLVVGPVFDAYLGIVAFYVGSASFGRSWK